MFFEDYVWVNGKPKGKSKVSEEKGDYFKIVKDPYGKRISLERFSSGQFLDCIYDSNLFDFRALISKVDSSWQKIEEKASILIRDGDDRTIAEEFYVMENGLCQECRIHYPRGPLVATQKMFYENDTLKALVLFDILGRPVALKMTDFESWNMNDAKTEEHLCNLLQ